MKKILILFGASLHLATSLSAVQPSPPRISVSTQLAPGKISVTIRNLEARPADVSVEPGPFSTVAFAPFKASLAAGETRTIPVAATIGPGRQALGLETTVTFPGRLPIRGQALYEPLRVEARSVSKTSYRDAFLNRRVALAPATARVGLNLGTTWKPVSPIPKSFPVFRIPGTVKLTPPLISPDVDFLKLPRLSLATAGGVFQSRLGRVASPIQAQPGLKPRTSIPVDSGRRVLKGQFVLKIAANSYQAATLWVVNVVQEQKGKWVDLGWTFVNTAGDWSITLSPRVDQGRPVKVLFTVANDFISLENPDDGEPYTWSEEVKLEGPQTDMGRLAGDLSSEGDMPGLATLYAGAMDLYALLLFNGINPCKDKPYAVVYPNAMETGHCRRKNDDGTEVPWSCCESGPDGKIYLVPEHANKSVIQHELAHGINFQYWQGWPKGSGGSHSLDQCYTAGLALAEGFANFIAYWAQTKDRGQGGVRVPYFGYDIESLPDDICEGEKNEMRVAAVFWDLHDSHDDGPDENREDSLNFEKWAGAVSLYLGHAKDKITDYLDLVVKAGVGAEKRVKGLFRRNTIDF